VREKTSPMRLKGDNVDMRVYPTRKEAITVMVSVLLVGATHAPLFALDDIGAVRCDQESIAIGENAFQVKTACGEPDSIQVRGLAKEVWIYNFGPTKFVYYLTFINGRLERIQAGDYGSYHDDRHLD
jgi:hypothetical protein